MSGVQRTSWFNVARCGLAQMAIGAVAALMTSTLNFRSRSAPTKPSRVKCSA